jgi:hypothetical protein
VKTLDPPCPGCRAEKFRLARRVASYPAAGLEIVNIDLRIVGPLFWQIFEHANSGHRADWNASAAVNALLWVYIELRHFVEVLLLGSLARRDNRDL